MDRLSLIILKESKRSESTVSGKIFNNETALMALILKDFVALPIVSINICHR